MLCVTATRVINNIEPLTKLSHFNKKTVNIKLFVCFKFLQMAKSNPQVRDLSTESKKN